MRAGLNNVGGPGLQGGLRLSGAALGDSGRAVLPPGR